MSSKFKNSGRKTPAQKNEVQSPEPKQQSTAIESDTSLLMAENQRLKDEINKLEAKYEAKLKDARLVLANESDKAVKLLTQLNAAKSESDQLKTKFDEQKRTITERDNELLSKQKKIKALHDQAKSNADRVERELQKAKARAIANLASQKAMYSIAIDEKIKELEKSVAEWKAKKEAAQRAGEDQYDTMFKEFDTYCNRLEHATGGNDGTERLKKLATHVCAIM